MYRRRILQSKRFPLILVTFKLMKKHCKTACLRREHKEAPAREAEKPRTIMHSLQKTLLEIIYLS
jgi:hypothetical protein